MIVLKVDNVSKTFKNNKRVLRAVDGVSLEVNEGEVFGLLGMNGAGKSTLIKMCTGLTLPSGGSIAVYGHDVVKDKAAAQSVINISPQETAVAMALTVRENLEFISRIYGADKASASAAAEEVMDRLKLTARAFDVAGKLSGGLMRRLSIGMALITKPRLMFLDEPTLGLDILARRELWKLVNEIKRDTSVVLTTHYLEEAEALCDRIAIMSHGKIVATGSADELKKLAGADKFEDAFLSFAGEEVDDAR